MYLDSVIGKHIVVSITGSQSTNSHHLRTKRRGGGGGTDRRGGETMMRFARLMIMKIMQRERKSRGNSHGTETEDSGILETEHTHTPSHTQHHTHTASYTTPMST